MTAENVAGSAELKYLTWTVLWTAMLWLPYIIHRIQEMGLLPALRNPAPDERPKAAWAYRCMCAHRNAVENLVVFAPLAITVSLLGESSAATGAAALVFFVMRVAHTLIYALGIPFFRTPAFAVGVICQFVLGVRILQVLG